MSSDETRIEISSRAQAAARVTASIVAGIIVYLGVTLPISNIGWGIAREPVPGMPPPQPEMYFNEAAFALTALLVYTVLSFWAAMA